MQFFGSLAEEKTNKYALLTKCEVNMYSSLTKCEVNMHVLLTKCEVNMYVLLTKREVNMYALLTKCEVNMARYWPSSFFSCLWSETKSRSINTQKTERGQYSAILTEQASSIKDLSYGFKRNVSCGIQRVVPSGQEGANHSARFESSCPLTELAI